MWKYENVKQSSTLNADTSCNAIIAAAISVALSQMKFCFGEQSSDGFAAGNLINNETSK